MNEIADREISALAVKLNESLANSISNLEKEMAVLVGNIEVPPDLISDQLRPVTQTLQSTLEELGSNTSSLMNQFQESVDANLVELRSLQERQTSAYNELTNLTEDSKQNSSASQLKFATKSMRRYLKYRQASLNPLKSKAPPGSC